ncbi:ABC transporter substrate-binding protein [Bradyrhizobium sp. Tv2a-2]|uniref:ABC transporter substrate-binding protein n=1 Tax=Bradyrhizobium sp. Tv2a-2 TaxID=113395 RepID=UPI0004229AF3|nr:ABC transporter substrate-binding protein [Bradyrhizobium sp. Tv2a-2]
MNHSVNRRRFMQATSSALAVGALSSGSNRVFAQSSRELRVNMSGGEYANALMNAFVKPFEAETGIKVIPVNQSLSDAQVGLMVKSKSVTVDVVIVNQISANSLAANGLLEDIDYSICKKDELGAITDYCKQPFGLAPYFYSSNMVYNTQKFPAGKPRPANWTEFWDVAKFPGARALQTGQFGSRGPWEEALLADGVAMDALYPMDIDRIFASLEKIKPHVRKWWAEGAEILQIMRDNVADIAQCVDGRALVLIDEGKPIEINRNQAKLSWDFCTIPKGSPNVQNAQKFIEVTTRADRQAVFAELFPLAPSNHSAYKLVPEKVAHKLATYPDYMANSFPINAKWYIETGPDGLSNLERLRQRWNAWSIR